MPVSIVTRKSYNKSSIAFPWTGNRGKYYPILPSQSCNNTYVSLQRIEIDECVLGDNKNIGGVT